MRFGIRFLLVVTFLVACASGLVAYDQGWFFWIVAVIGINGLGAAAAIVITKLFKFPTDGGYRSAVIRAEQGPGDDGKHLKSSGD